MMTYGAIISPAAAAATAADADNNDDCVQENKFSEISF